jgi:hypothetical protein
MINKLSDKYILISPKTVEKFIKENEITLKLLNDIELPLKENFPDSKISLEVCDDLEWVDDAKLLVNMSVDENMFFNGILDNFNNVYKEIQTYLDEYVSTIVLFPEINGKDLTPIRMNSNSAHNLIARTAYFNPGCNYEINIEITLREIPREQRREEILDYCKSHDTIDSSEIAFELRLESYEVNEILEELKNENIIDDWE